ncbi:helix-turn-helix domain-containing protein [Photorhabdus caribbeanensis]|uniref:helix-turn-helix domain-containing protein n=1 Tax=Photorhabdus caribbeanensis TaxID=1004165 RepID=UPI0030EBD15A
MNLSVIGDNYEDHITSNARTCNERGPQKSKLTQRETADRVGIKQSTVSGFEKYPEGSKMETLFNLLSALELELHVSERGGSQRTSTGWKEEW